jgi:hypothetical protein
MNIKHHEYRVLKRWAVRFNRPTTGPGAAYIWQLLSNHNGPAYILAERIYRNLGYVPFSGYPLTRKEEKE